MEFGRKPPAGDGERRARSRSKASGAGGAWRAGPRGARRAGGRIVMRKGRERDTALTRPRPGRAEAAAEKAGYGGTVGGAGSVRVLPRRPAEGGGMACEGRREGHEVRVVRRGSSDVTNT